MGHIAQLPRISYFYFVVGGLISAGILLTFLHRGAIASQLDDWKLLPRPERLTELYFTDHATLPLIFSPGDSQTLEFTIRNQEHQTTNYRYVLTATGTAAGQEQVLGDGHVTLNDGESQHITPTIEMPGWNRVKIQVQLEYTTIPFGQDKPGLQTQTIHYWVNVADMAT